MLLVTAYGAGNAGATPAAFPFYGGRSSRVERRNIQRRPLPENLGRASSEGHRLQPDEAQCNSVSPLF